METLVLSLDPEQLEKLPREPDSHGYKSFPSQSSLTILQGQLSLLHLSLLTF